MIPKSGHRFSEEIMRQLVNQEHVPVHLNREVV